MKRITIKQLTKQAQDILSKNGVTPKCLLVQCNLFTHADGSQNYNFSINADNIFMGKSPEECLAKLKSHYIPKFVGEVDI